MAELKFHGLNQAGRQLVSATVDVVEGGMRLYPCGGQVSFERSVPVLRLTKSNLSVADVGDGFSVQLSSYTGVHGERYDEYVLEAVRNCNVHVILALKDAGGNVVPESVWTDWERAAWTNCLCRYTC